VYAFSKLSAAKAALALFFHSISFFFRRDVRLLFFLPEGETIGFFSLLAVEISPRFFSVP